MVDSPPQVNGSPETQAKRSALQAQREDARKALEWFTGPSWARVEEYYRTLLDPHERALHNVNLESATRDRACFAVYVGRQFLGAKAHFERRLKDADRQLADMEPAKHSERVWDRILSFTR